MEGILVVLGMFLLRLGVPVAVTIAIGYLLHRLDAKWQAEAQAQWEAQDPVQEEMVDVLQMVDPEKLCRKAEGYEALRQELEPDCAIWDVPCWVARLRVTGKLPLECRNCELFAASLAS